MKKLTFTTFALLALAAGTSVHAATVPAVPTYTTFAGAGADVLIQNNDLIEGMIATVSGTPQAGNAASVTDGLSSGNGSVGGNNVWLLNTPISFTYALTGSATGYDITNISSIAGWVNHNDASQDFTVTYTTLTGSGTLGSYAYNLPSADFDSGNFSTQVLINDGGAGTGSILANVTSLTVTYTNTEGSSDGGTILHELDVDGAASAALPVPEPSTYAMMFAGLAVLGVCVRRKAARLS